MDGDPVDPELENEQGNSNITLSNPGTTPVGRKEDRRVGMRNEFITTSDPPTKLRRFELEDPEEAERNLPSDMIENTFINTCQSISRIRNLKRRS